MFTHQEGTFSSEVYLGLNPHRYSNLLACWCMEIPLQQPLCRQRRPCRRTNLLLILFVLDSIKLCSLPLHILSQLIPQCLVKRMCSRKRVYRQTPQVRVCVGLRWPAPLEERCALVSFSFVINIIVRLYGGIRLCAFFERLFPESYGGGYICIVQSCSSAFVLG